jgi:hypothetical protein
MLITSLFFVTKFYTKAALTGWSLRYFGIKFKSSNISSLLSYHIKKQMIWGDRFG